MSKAKPIVAMCIGLLALTAFASASASAATAGWMVNRTMLVGSKALATTAAVDQEGILKGPDFTIKCKGKILDGVGAQISSPSMGLATSLTFLECKGEAPCSISSPTISTVPILAEATLEGALAVKVLFSPETKATFTTIGFEGETCALLGTQPVTGHASVLAPTGQDESTLQLINAISNEASGELKVGSSPASLSGSALLRLASGESWSFL